VSGRVDCQAEVAGENTRSHSGIGVATYKHRRCSRRARESVGALLLCGTHARMACEGLLDERGCSGDPADLQNRRAKPSLRFTWAAGLSRVPLPAD